MKNIVYILLFITNITFGQTVNMTEPEIEKYAKSVEKLRKENKLVNVSYFNKSACGGALDGYYLNKQLVLIDATFSIGLESYSRIFYIAQDKVVKIIYRENLAEWEKYEEKYPSSKFEFDATKMTYTDTSYSIILTDPIVFHKKSINKVISTQIDQSLIDMLISCEQSMKLELQEVIKMMDDLKFVKEMPYLCESGICGETMFWDAVIIGKNNLEILIDKLDDTTSTNANVVLFGGTYTVADIAFDVLTEIIHDIPTFELLGVPFDNEGCGYCSYWQHLNKDFSNRQKFKEAVRKWYHKNKDNLVWVQSKGEYPNDGHFIHKKVKK